MKRHLLLLVVIAAIARTHTIDRPWSHGDHDGWGGAFYSNIARNYNRYGLLETRFAPVVSTGETPRDERQYYLTHPPSIGFAVAASFRVFGEHEWSARLVPLLFGLGSVLLVFRLASSLWSKEVGLLAAAVMAFAPEQIVYGTHVDSQGPPVTFFALLLLLAYRERKPLLALGALVLGAGFDWPVHYMVGLVALDALVFAREWRRPALVLVATSVLLVGGFFVYARTVVPRAEQEYLGSSAIESYLFWSGIRVSPDRIPGSRMEAPSAGEWFRRAGVYVTGLFTIPILLLAALGAGASGKGEQRRTLLGLLAWGGLHVLLFPFGAYVHDYWWSYLLPGLAIAASLGLSWIAGRISMPRWPMPRWAGAAAAVALGAFLLFQGLRRMDEIGREPVRLGPMLHDVTGKEEGILSLYPVDARDAYYADRTIRQGVNSVAKFQERLEDGVRYRYFIVPRFVYSERPGKPLFQQLTECCPRLQFDDYYVFDLEPLARPTDGEE